jgi:phosphoribosylanthranilate isomerase
MTYVKICGCRTVEDALAARDAGADFIGVVFAESPRRVSVGTAREIARALRHHVSASTGRGEAQCRGGLQSSRSETTSIPTPLKNLLTTRRPLLVGVFESQGPGEVESIATRSGIDVVQLHGETRFNELLDRLPVIRAFASDDAALLDASPSAMCLLDSSRGHGRLGDWDSLAKVAARMPVILAGGLTPDNVAEAVRRVRPWGVDVSSGVETAGRKDAAKMLEFVAAVRGA